VIKAAPLIPSIWCLETYHTQAVAKTINNARERNPRKILTDKGNSALLRGIIVAAGIIVANVIVGSIIVSAVKHQNVSILQGKYKKIRDMRFFAVTKISQC